MQSTRDGTPGHALRRLGKYELITRIGVGGMAEVYLARQRGPMNFEKVVVVKKIHPHLAQQQEFINMLLDEARISALLKHPNVVDIYDLGMADDTYFIAMEYLPGQPLSRVLQVARTKGSPGIYATAQFICDAARGLHAAHDLRTIAGEELHLVHRDVSPGNLILLYDGTVRLVDFGVSKARGRLTQTGVHQLKGKTGYVSPEQVRGLPIDRRSDIFSLGIVMWESLTLRRLFHAKTDADKLTAIIGGAEKPPSWFRRGLPAKIDEICMRALQVDRELRYQSASEMADELEEVIRGLDRRDDDNDLRKYMSSRFDHERRDQERLIREAGARGTNRAAVLDDLETNIVDPGARLAEIAETRELPRASSGSIRLPDSALAMGQQEAVDEDGETGTPSVVIDFNPDSLLDARAPAQQELPRGAGWDAQPLPSIQRSMAASGEHQALADEVDATIPAGVETGITHGEQSWFEEDVTGTKPASEPSAAHALPRADSLGISSTFAVLAEESKRRTWVAGAIAVGLLVGILVVIGLVGGGDKKPATDGGSEPAAEIASEGGAAAEEGDPAGAGDIGEAPEALEAAAEANPDEATGDVPGEPATATVTEAPEEAPPIGETTAAEPPPAPQTTPPKPASKPAPKPAPKRRKARRPSTRPRAKTPVAPAADPAELYRKGLQAFVKGQLDTALTHLKAAVKARRSFAPAHRALGMVYQRMGDKSKAVRELKTYLKLAPSARDAEAIGNLVKKLEK